MDQGLNENLIQQQQFVQEGNQQQDNPNLKEVQELLKPYEEEISKLEEAEKLKMAEINALKLAIKEIKSQFEEHLKQQNEENKEQKGIIISLIKQISKVKAKQQQDKVKNH